MKSLQEILDEVNLNRLCQMTDGKIQQHLNGVNVSNKVNLNKSKMTERGKTLGSTVGKFNLTDYSRDQSKVPTMCPNCHTVGPLSNIKQHHFNNCKRTVGYSDFIVIENHKKGMSAWSISQESGISYPQTKRIIRNYKKNLVGK
jgi:hypothetical protein